MSNMPTTPESKIRVATRWFRNGDHPHDYDEDVQGLKDGVMTTFTGEYRRKNGWEGSVVRRFRDAHTGGETQCPICNREMAYHGWIDEGERGTTVCPGDYVVTDKYGLHYTLSPRAFEDLPSVCLESKVWYYNTTVPVGAR